MQVIDGGISFSARPLMKNDCLKQLRQTKGISADSQWECVWSARRETAGVPLLTVCLLFW